MKIVLKKPLYKPSKSILLSVILLICFMGGIVFGAYSLKNAHLSYISMAFKYVKKTGFNFISNALVFDVDDIDTFYLDVKFKEWKKLADQRNKVYNYSTLLKVDKYQWHDSIDKVEIKGKISSESINKKVKIKLLGMNYDHFSEPKKWAFKISVRGDNSIDRQKKFNLLIPRSRYFLDDFVGQKFLKELNMIYLRIKPVKLVLNGDDLGIYYKEEFYDKRLIEHSNFRESAIVRLNNYEIGISETKYLKYKDLLDKFKTKIDLVTNNKAEVSDLFDVEKMADRIAISILFGDHHSLIWFNQRYYLNPFTAKLEPLGREWIYSQYINKKSVVDIIESIKNKSPLYQALFKNDVFLKKLNKSISMISSSLFLKGMNKKYSNDIERLKKAFYSEYRFFDTPQSLIHKNAAILRKEDNWITSNPQEEKRSKLNNLLKYFKVYKDTLLVNKEISIKEKIHIPEGYKVIVKPGAKLMFEDYGQIISESPFIAMGTKKDSIRFEAKTRGNNNRGILFLNTKGSVFKYVKFIGLRNYNDEFRSLPGSICFYESTVSFSNSTFDTSYGGDDLLNIVRSHYDITNSELLNSKADALDSDFSNGVIKNTLFKNIGNDAIDVSGTTLDISDITIIGVQDKGISVGEDSHITGKNIIINNSSLALTSKDLSTLKLDGVQVDNCDVVFAVFQKKSEYGYASINCQNATYKNYKEEYLVQKNNTLIINSNEINLKVKDVESKLYGAIYGKSSK